MIKGNRALNNAAWMIGAKVLQAALGIVITMLTTRYLGPSNYGLINYAASLVAFAAPIGRLGLDAILVNELIKYPEKEGETLGTSIGMSLISGIACMIGLACFTRIANPNERMTVIVCVLYSTVLLAHAFELIQYWFQAHLLSKYTSIATLISYAAKSAYQIILLINGKSICWFAVVSALDIFAIDGIVLWIYKRKSGQKFAVSATAAKRMFAQSKYYIASSMMMTVFVNTDRIMLKLMLGDTQTGYYSAAVACASLTSFVFVAIISSMRPIILEANEKDNAKFRNSLTFLYSAIIYLSLLQCAVISTLAPIIVKILYGVAYAPTVTPLRWIVWYTTFSYLGSVRNIWILAKKKQHILLKINFIGAFGNVALNYCFIPVWGITGAAVASLLTQLATNVFLNFLMKELRPTLVYMKDACKPEYIRRFFKRVTEK